MTEQTNPPPGAAIASAPRRRLYAVLLALAIGSVGGWLAHLTQIPLAWLIGAMLATMTAALLRAPVQLPMSLRNLMVAVLGLMLGSRFTPEIAEQILHWGVSLAALVLYGIAASAAVQYYFRRACGYDRPTSYFCAMPGGLTEMTLVGNKMGGDFRIISLTHTSRILLVVLALPFAFQVLTNADMGDRPPAGPLLSTLAPSDLGILIVCGIAGVAMARALRIPAAAMIGPMLLSAVVHLAGWSQAQPPVEIIAAAQVVVGASVGCRFAGAQIAFVARTVLRAAGGTAILLLATLAFAQGIGWAMDLSREALFLAYAPGGVAEMSLVAIAIGADAAFVATHQMFRVIIIVIGAPLVYRVLMGGRKTSV